MIKKKINKRKIENDKSSNLSKLERFRSLEENWNGYGGEPFNDALIDKCISFVEVLPIHRQPMIYPTGRSSIQFEYEKNEMYLEIEIYEDKIEVYTDFHKNELEINDASWEQVIEKINQFYERSYLVEECKKIREVEDEENLEEHSIDITIYASGMTDRARNMFEKMGYTITYIEKDKWFEISKRGVNHECNSDDNSN